MIIYTSLLHTAGVSELIALRVESCAWGEIRLIVSPTFDRVAASIPVNEIPSQHENRSNCDHSSDCTAYDTSNWQRIRSRGRSRCRRRKSSGGTDSLGLLVRYIYSGHTEIGAKAEVVPVGVVTVIEETIKIC